jgi:hypothetical protein
MTTRDHDDAKASKAGTKINEDRRAVLKSVAKYAAFMAGTSAVILTPETALAKKACSVAQENPGNNCV